MSDKNKPYVDLRDWNKKLGERSGEPDVQVGMLDALLKRENFQIPPWDKGISDIVDVLHDFIRSVNYANPVSKKAIYILLSEDFFGNAARFANRDEGLVGMCAMLCNVQTVENFWGKEKDKTIKSQALRNFFKLGIDNLVPGEDDATLFFVRAVCDYGYHHLLQKRRWVGHKTVLDVMFERSISSISTSVRDPLVLGSTARRDVWELIGHLAANGQLEDRLRELKEDWLASRRKAAGTQN